VKVRDVVKLLEADGWRLIAVKGSHRQFRHPSKSGKVTVPGTPGKELARGTLRSILKQARLGDG
jgi:predicted RNA binding protein YcfA (HicA-like mRNA interferase family)